MLRTWLILITLLFSYSASATEIIVPYPYFNCKDRSIKIEGPKGESIEIELDGKKHTLSLSSSASGAKYETATNSKPHILFWQKGHTAVFAIDDKQYNACHQVLGSKTLENELYHASGINPTWELILYPNKILFSEGEDKTYLARPIAEASKNHSTIYTLDQDEVSSYIKITKTEINAPCLDKTTGLHYPDQVNIRINEQDYNGCGAPALTNNHFKSIIQNTNWVAKSINNTSLEDHAIVSIAFGKDNKLNGFSGCNTYSGTYELEDDYIKINPIIATTKKACASHEVTKNESLFLSLLPKMIILSFGINGELLLKDASNETIITLTSE